MHTLLLWEWQGHRALSISLGLLMLRSAPGCFRGSGVANVQDQSVAGTHAFGKSFWDPSPLLWRGRKGQVELAVWTRLVWTRLARSWTASTVLEWRNQSWCPVAVESGSLTLVCSMTESAMVKGSYHVQSRAAKLWKQPTLRWVRTKHGRHGRGVSLSINQWNDVICWKMDGTGDHVKRYKSNSDI